MADATLPEGMRKAGSWVMVWGVLLIIAGAFAILVPPPAAMAAILLLAWLFVFAGIIEVVYAFHQREEGFGWKLASALATLVLGVLMLLFPVATIASVALLIGGFMFATGLSNVMLAFKVKPKAGWGWVLFDGALSIVIAILIAMGWPQDSVGFVGILVGICLISGGVWRIVLGRALRSGAAPGNPA